MPHDRLLRARLSRRQLAGVLCLWSAVPSSLLAAELPSSFPSRPISLIVPWPAGGATDITMRILADLVARQLGQPVVVENRPGAAGTLVGPALRSAAPDGYTIGQLPLTLYRFPFQQKVAWDPLRDIVPVIQISGVTFGIVVPADSPFQSLADLIAWARAQPKRLTVGSTGIGTTAHLAMEEIMALEGVSYIHVPYKGTADQMLAIAGAQIMAGVNSTGFAPWVEKGQMRLLATFNATRNPRWPAAPTMRELGYPQAVYTSPWGLAVPRGVDEAVVQALHDAFHQALFRPRHTAELGRYDQQVEYLDTAAYRRAVLDTVERETRLLRRLNLLAARTERSPTTPTAR